MGESETTVDRTRFKRGTFTIFVFVKIYLQFLPPSFSYLATGILLKVGILFGDAHYLWYSSYYTRIVRLFCHE